MDIEKNLIFLKGEDKTKEIKWIKSSKGMQNVTFNSGKTFSYAYDKVKWLQKPEELNLDETVLYINKVPKNGVGKILQFGIYIRVIYTSGYSELCKKRDIKLVKSSLEDEKSKNCFKYLYSISTLIKINGTNFLEEQYKKIDFINPESVLAKYLNKGELKKTSINSQLIYPFGFNKSQKEATEKALHNNISIIEGPPGTGKTQTILNIIANALLNNKTVAVVSNNNSATKNVIEKLEKYGVDFIAAFLGNNENKEEFLENQSGNYPDMEGWFLNYEEETEKKAYLNDYMKSLDEKVALKNELAKLKENLNALEVEREHFLSSTEIPNIKKYKSIFTQSSDRILRLWITFQYFVDENISFTTKLKYFFRYGIYTPSFYSNDISDVIIFLQNLYLEKVIEEHESKIKNKEGILFRFGFDENMKEFLEVSMEILKSQLYKNYKEKKNGRVIFNKSNLWKNFSKFIEEYPVILSTTHSLRSCIEKNYLFDYLIIDEASQVDIVSGALALSCGKNAIIVGDEKQLPNVVEASLEKLTDKVFQSFNLHEEYKYSKKSLLTSFKTLYSDVPYTLLKEHYRCNPRIIGFCNEKFYNGELIALTEDNVDNPLMVYKTVEGNHSRGKVNQREVDVIINEIIPKEGLEGESIGIISPHRNQANLIQQNLEKSNIKIDKIEADTVHKFQGREKENIIISTVKNEMNEFISSPNLINVAVSRAVNRLILVVSGNEKFLNANSNINDLIKYITYNDLENIKESKIISVFDNLYKPYNEKRLQLLKNINKSQYDSENLMSLVLDEVLSEKEFSSLNYVMNYSLRNLINDDSKLNSVEKKYVNNINTHVDFIIISKMDKSPILVIEVDGYKYHNENEKQLKRDKMKDDVLYKYRIPILRLNTTGSNEKSIIIDKINMILKEWDKNGILEEFIGY